MLHLWTAIAVLVAGPARASRRAQQGELDAVQARAPGASDEAEVAPLLALGLPGQLSVALESHPEVRVAFEQWHAAARSISVAGALPSPTVDFSVFLQSIETRVGPQQGRIGVRQAIPWPTSLTAGTEAAVATSKAAGGRFEARVLDVAWAVEDAHWALWAVRTSRSIHRDHHALVEGLSGTVRGRLEVGAATLADLQQVDLAHARLSDDIARMDEAERAAMATLRAAIGTWTNDPLPTPEAPGGPFLPAEEPMVLEAAALAHPLLREARQRVTAAEEAVRVARAGRLPGFTVGADWIAVGDTDSVHIEPGEGGQDAVAVGLGLSIPLWQKSAADRVSAAEARARGERSAAEGRELAARAALHRALAEVEATGRRVATIEGTLLPQAEAAYASLLGTYTAGTSSVAQVLLSQQTLLELRLDLVDASARHARALARLRAACGRDVETRLLVQPEQ